MVDIKNLNIKVQLKTMGKSYLVIFRDAPEERVYPILDFLRELFSAIPFNNAKYFMILLKDFGFYKDKYLRQAYPHNEDYIKGKKALDNFIAYISIGAEAINTEDNKVVKLDELLKTLTEDDKNKLFGAYFFYYALLRYTSSELEESDIDGFSTLYDAVTLISTSKK